MKKLRISASASLPTAHGNWHIVAFGKDHVALLMGEVAGAKEVLVRMQSECVTGEVFGSLRCDCCPQLRLAMDRIARAGRGIVLYLRQEGRGIGIFDKIRAYHLQDHGLDTVEANVRLGLPVDARTYGDAARALEAFGVRSIRLMSNSPDKAAQLRREGIHVAARVPLRTKANRYNAAYLKTKKKVMHHDL